MSDPITNENPETPDDDGSTKLDEQQLGDIQGGVAPETGAKPLSKKTTDDKIRPRTSPDFLRSSDQGPLR
jgi:hypothetical protein